MSAKISPSNIALQAEKIERLSVKLIQEKNWGALEALLDPACQFVSMNGAYDRASAMNLMKQMNLGPVEFKDFQVTQSQDNVIVSFWLAALEYHDGRALSPTFSPRLSVWKVTQDQWRCIAYADLISPKT